MMAEDRKYIEKLRDLSSKNFKNKDKGGEYAYFHVCDLADFIVEEIQKERKGVLDIIDGYPYSEEGAIISLRDKLKQHWR